VTSEPGNYFTGIDKGFTCFTKSLQRLDFTKDLGQPIYARTREGLPLELDLTIEYRLLTHELRDLLLEFPVVPSTAESDDTAVADGEKAGEGAGATKYSMSYRP
jgi:hypothetical protein